MSAPEQAPRRPYGVACVSCRRAKMRCVLHSDKPRCERCARLQKVCMFEATRRGQWRGFNANEGASRRAIGPANQPHSPVFETSDSALPNPSPASDSSLSVGNQPWPFNINQTPMWEPSGRHNSMSSVTSPLTEEKTSFSLPSFVKSEDDTGELSLDVALDPVRRALDGSGGHTASNKSTGSSDRDDMAWKKFDPVQKKLSSLPSAQYLFQGFMNHFNSITGFMDPYLYTFSYTREASSLLFTTILSISSTVFRPELHQSLRQHQEMLLGRALLACDSSVETIWTLCLLYYWKDVDDRRGFNFVGYGLQLARSAEWNKTNRGWSSAVGPTVAESELETEMVVRKRRTIDHVWLLLASLDRTLSIFTGRPFSCPPIIGECTSRSWVGKGRWSDLWSDTRHVSHYELSTICRPLYEFIITSQPQKETATNEPPPNLSHELDTFGRLLSVFNHDIDEWRDHWVPWVAKLPQSQPFLEPEFEFYWAYLKLHFNSTLLYRILTQNNNVSDPAAIEVTRLCYTCAMKAVKSTTIFASMDQLYYLWDSAHLMTAYSAMLLLKIVNLASNVISDVSATEAREALYRLLVAYNSAAQSLSLNMEDVESSEPPQKTPASNSIEAQSRLLRSLVKSIDTHIKDATVLRQAVDASVSINTGSSTAEASHGVDESSPPWSLVHTRSIGQDSDSQVIEGQSSSMPGSSGGNEPGVAHLTEFDTNVTELVEEMDFSLDRSYLDSRFKDAGLLLWDELLG